MSEAAKIALEKDLDEEGIVLRYTFQNLRLMGAAIRKDSGFTSAQVEAFLALYKQALSQAVDSAVLNFMREKLG